MINLIGKLLGNRYLILEKIGEGGMALVYKAKCQLLNRYVAVKILRPEFTADEEFVQKFKRESLAVASLSHSNIVGVYDVGEDDGIYYIVMEYVNGTTLKEYIKNNGAIDYREALNIAAQIATALDHAHKNGVIHRDIKSHNILLTEDMTVKVTDFGIARAATSGTMTNTGRVIGSVHYFSPEQARGGFTDQRTDLYSLGVVLYEMLTGKLPYDADSPISIALKHIQDAFVEPSVINPKVPKSVNSIVVKAMEKDMAKRYQGARDMLDDINKVLLNPSVSLINEQVDESTRIIPMEQIDEALGQNKRRTGNNKNKKNKIIIILVTLATLIIFGIIMGIEYSRYSGNKNVNLPDIIGMNVDDAEELLKEKGLLLEVAARVKNEAPEGEILQVFSNKAGDEVRKGSKIKVQVSAGLEKTKVPDITGKSPEDAKKLLVDAKLELGTQSTKNSDTVEKGLIIEQSIKKGEEVEPGTAVDVTVSSGPSAKLTTVPVLIGRTLEEAQQKLRENGLITDITYGYDGKYVDGVVISQGVAAGTQIVEGQTITIVVNKVQQTTPTPSPTEEQPSPSPSEAAPSPSPTQGTTNP